MTGRRFRLGLVALLATLALLGAACGSDDDDSESSSASTPADQGTEAIELRSTMRTLWAEHMQWTYATVDAFFHDAAALEPTLQRLLDNQDDIGAAVGTYYGDDAGASLTELLRAHINGAVPVLQAAQAGDAAALETAQDDWYGNARDVADFLTEANPDSWPQSATAPALEMHIEQTTTYAVDLLEGDFATAIEDYDHAFDHMMGLADILTDGIVTQFPDRFTA